MGSAYRDMRRLRRVRTQRQMQCGQRASTRNPASADVVPREPDRSVDVSGRCLWLPGWRERRVIATAARASTAVLRPFLSSARDIAAAIAIQILECDAACDSAGMRRSIAGDSHPRSARTPPRRTRAAVGAEAIWRSPHLGCGRVGKPLKWTIARSLSCPIDSLRLFDEVRLGTRTRSNFGAIATSMGLRNCLSSPSTPTWMLAGSPER